MIIYKVTNRLNGKIYIGQTCRSLVQRWRQHCCVSSGCVALHHAIQKYGADNFTVEQIDVACDRAELDLKEQFWIRHYDCMVPNGYNLTAGGDGCPGYSHSDETKRLLSKLKTGKPGTAHTDEWKAAASARQFGGTHPHKGHPLSEEQKKILSQCKKGKAFPQKYKRIRCIELELAFDSRKDAAMHVGVSPSAITNAIKRGTKCGGFRWEYV